MQAKQLLRAGPGAPKRHVGAPPLVHTPWAETGCIPVHSALPLCVLVPPVDQPRDHGMLCTGLMVCDRIYRVHSVFCARGGGGAGYTRRRTELCDARITAIRAPSLASACGQANADRIWANRLLPGQGCSEAARKNAGQMFWRCPARGNGWFTVTKRAVRLQS